MSSNLQSPESKNQSPYLPTNEVKTREEFLQKIGNRKPNTRKMTLHGEYVEIELDTSNTFSIKRETLQQITKEINKEMDVENLQDLNKLMSTLEKKSAYSATKSELNALQVEPYIANRLEKQPFTTLEGFITALTELENDFHLKKQFVKQNFGQRLIDPFQKDDTKQRMQKETTEKLDAWISYLHNFRKEKAEERKKTAKYNKKAAKKGNAEITPEISQTDLDNFMDAFHQRDLLSTDVKNFQAGNLTPKAGFPINSKKYVKRSISESRKYYEMQKDLNKIKNDAAVLKIFGNSAEEAERYFDAVINGQMSPQMDQYYQQVADHFGQHISDYPFLAKQLVATRGLALPGTRGTTGMTGTRQLPHGPNASVDYSQLDRGESFTQGGIRGVINKIFNQFPNLTPEQKRTRSGWTTVGIVGFAARKGISRLFKSKAKGGMARRQKGLTLAGVTFGTQALLGENPLSLLGKLVNGGISFEEFGQRLKNSTTLRGGEKNPTYQQNTKDRGLTQFFGDMTPAQLETNMKTREHPNQWSAFYVPTLAKLKQQYKENAKPFEELGPQYEAAKFRDRLQRIGVGYPTTGTLKDKTFSEIYTTRSNNQEYLNNTDALNKQGLTQNNAKIDRINWYLVHTDLSDPQIIEQMKTEGLLETNHNAAYTARPEDVKALSEFSTQINTQLTSLTPEQKTKLNTAIATFYNERSVDHKPKLNLTQEGEKIFIESHQDETTEKFQKIEINVKDRTLPGFSKSGEQITFADTTELVRAAYLTNGLMNVTKNMEAKSDNPFEFRAFSVEGPGMFFNGKKRNEWGLDTKMVSYPMFFGWFGTMDQVAKPLYDHPKEYSAYLNTLRNTYQKQHPTGKTWAEQQATGQKEHETSASLEDISHTKAQIDQLGLSDADAYLAQQACNEIYATYREEAKSLGIHLTKQGDLLTFTSYGKEIKINLTTKTLEGLTLTGEKAIVFSDIKELIKASNLINAIKYHSTHMTAEQNPVDPITQQQKHQDHPFYLKTGNLEFRGIEKNTTVATGITSLLTRLPGFNNAIKANAPTLDQHKQELVTYLNISQPPFRDNSLN